MADKTNNGANRNAAVGSGVSRLDALYQWLSFDLQRLKTDILRELQYTSMQMGSVYEGMKQENEKTVGAIQQELRYGYQQAQSVYEGLQTAIEKSAAPVVTPKTEETEKTQDILNELSELRYSYMQMQAVYEELIEKMSVVADGAQNQEIEKLLGEINALLADGCGVKEEDLKQLAAKTEESVGAANTAILGAIAGIAVPENVDYTRIVDEVGDKMLEILNEVKTEQPEEVTAKVDYDRIIDGTTEKVVESMPFIERINYDKIAEAVAGTIDYERLADMVADKIMQKAQATREIVLDQEGVNAIAQAVAENIGNIEVYIPAEETVIVEEPTEEPVVETVEEVVEEPVVEVVEEPAAPAPSSEEISAAESALKEELAIAMGGFQEVDNQLVDAETGLVVRLKKSFTAKIKQSDDKVKEYYSMLKNELTSYKKLNSNVSWHADRFNFGRDTVAKINIVGKTLGLYLALDPNSEEFKTTVYHQKDVSDQKAYESTPFMVKIKSDAAAKKALRLVEALAEKLGTQKEENFAPVNYVEEMAYETTKALFDAGYIKATKEKKVELDF